MKPIFKYSGGKTKELKRIKEILPKKINRVIEPFAGGAAVSFDLEKPSILCDIRSNNIVTYRAVRDHFDEVSSYLDTIKSIQDIKELEKIYYYQRDQKFRTEDPIEVAQRWIILRQLCFSGMDRINKGDGKFSVPFGWYKKFQTSLSKNHRDFLQNCDLILGDWKEAFDKGVEDDFTFLDPPYYNRNSEYGGDYEDNEQLHIDIAERFKNSPSNCMMIHIDCPLYRELYEGYPIITRSHTYSQNFKGRDNTNQKVSHLYITNYEVSPKNSPLF
jgi:DNA adenine methylase